MKPISVGTDPGYGVRIFAFLKALGRFEEAFSKHEDNPLGRAFEEATEEAKSTLLGSLWLDVDEGAAGRNPFGNHPLRVVAEKASLPSPFQELQTPPRTSARDPRIRTGLAIPGGSPSPCVARIRYKGTKPIVRRRLEVLVKNADAVALLTNFVGFTSSGTWDETASEILDIVESAGLKPHLFLLINFPLPPRGESSHDRLFRLGLARANIQRLIAYRVVDGVVKTTRTNFISIIATTPWAVEEELARCSPLGIILLGMSEERPMEVFYSRWSDINRSASLNDPDTLFMDAIFMVRASYIRFPVAELLFLSTNLLAIEFLKFHLRRPPRGGREIALAMAKELEPLTSLLSPIINGRVDELSPLPLRCGDKDIEGFLKELLPLEDEDEADKLLNMQSKEVLEEISSSAREIARNVEDIIEGDFIEKFVHEWGIVPTAEGLEVLIQALEVLLHIGGGAFIPAYQRALKREEEARKYLRWVEKKKRAEVIVNARGAVIIAFAGMNFWKVLAPELRRSVEKLRAKHRSLMKQEERAEALLTQFEVKARRVKDAPPEVLAPGGISLITSPEKLERVARQLFFPQKVEETIRAMAQEGTGIAEEEIIRECAKKVRKPTFDKLWEWLKEESPGTTAAIIRNVIERSRLLLKGKPLDEQEVAPRKILITPSDCTVFAKEVEEMEGDWQLSRWKMAREDIVLFLQIQPTTLTSVEQLRDLDRTASQRDESLLSPRPTLTSLLPTLSSLLDHEALSFDLFTPEEYFYLGLACEAIIEEDGEFSICLGDRERFPIGKTQEEAISFLSERSWSRIVVAFQATRNLRGVKERLGRESSPGVKSIIEKLTKILNTTGGEEDV